MKFTPAFAGAMSGSVGGLTASRNRGLQYFRRRAVPVNPNTDWQQNVRSIFGDLSFQWSNTLDSAERLAWIEYAKQTAWVDVLGQTINLTGQQMFIRSNVPRMQNTLYGTGQGYTGFADLTPQVDAAPTNFNLAPLPGLAAYSVEIGGTDTDLTLANFTLGVIATDTILIYAGPAQTSGTSFYKGPYLMVGSIAATFVTTTLALDDIAVTTYSARFAQPTIGTFLPLQLRTSTEDGRLSRPSRWQVPVIAAA